MTTVSIATWNVNSVKARLTHLLEWLKSATPDIVCLQELKCTEDAFPYQIIEDTGYHVCVHGQKSYNGVAILSRHPIEDTSTTLPADPDPTQARFIETIVSLPEAALRVASVYVPNGREVDSSHFTYKLAFFDALYQYIQTRLPLEEHFIIGGDYNVAPTDLDVYDPEGLRNSICFHPQEQAKFRALCHLGMSDAYHLQHPDTAQFSWWDYRASAWRMNKGMRIDHLLLSPQAADTLESCDVDAQERGKTKASDHAPVVCQLRVA